MLRGCWHSWGCDSYSSLYFLEPLDACALLLTTGSYLNWVNSKPSKSRQYNLQLSTLQLLTDFMTSTFAAATHEDLKLVEV